MLSFSRVRFQARSSLGSYWVDNPGVEEPETFSSCPSPVATPVKWPGAKEKKSQVLSVEPVFRFVFLVTVQTARLSSKL